jgi:hypothetical protein
MSGHVVVVIDGAGKRHEIPDIWIAGFCQANECGSGTALEWWLYQARLAEQWETDNHELTQLKRILNGEE